MKSKLTFHSVLPALLAWAGLSLMLHLGWEVIQMPLYTLWKEDDALHIAWSITHCTAGDVLIACATFTLASLCLRRVDWPIQAPWRGLAILLTSGVAYTVFSEWRNVYRLGSWSYTDAMPTLWGIGLAPITQWLLVPILTLWMFKRVRSSSRPNRRGLDGP